MKKPIIPVEFLKNWGLKKHAHDVERRKLKTSKRSLKVPSTYVSAIVTMLGTGVLVSPNVLRSKKLLLPVPENFSIIDNPKKSLEIILGFAKDIRASTIKEIFYDHSNVNKIDLSAECLLGCLAGEISKEKSNKNKIKENGLYPKKRSAIRLIKTVGVIRNLNVSHELLGHEELKTLRVFMRRNRSYVKHSAHHSSDYKEKAVISFVHHINNCLLDHGRKLKPESVLKLVAYTGEIITNAEDHAGFKDWTIIAYLDNDSDRHFCEITIFNFGSSIAETLQCLDGDSFTRKQISPYLDAHKKKGFFNTGWNEQDLLTLVALQGNISSKNLSDQDDRGQGTVDLVKFFQKIHHECVPTERSEAKMAILSGNTHILFDGKYQMEPDHAGRPVIAFNATNDLRDMPDRNYVQSLGEINFPGTIIGIKFPMQIEVQTDEVGK